MHFVEARALPSKRHNGSTGKMAAGPKFGAACMLQVQINGNNCKLTIGGSAAAAAAPASLTGGSVGGAESVAGATSLNQNTATDASSAGGVQPGPGAGTRRL